MAICVVLVAADAVGAAGVPVNVGDAKSALAEGAIPDQLCRLADSDGVSVPEPVIGLPDHVMPVAFATATLVTVPPPPPPEGGEAQLPSPRR